VKTLPGFEELVAECERRARGARAAARAEWDVLPARGGAERATLVVLHGRTGNLRDLRDRWGVAADRGATVVVVQSSQIAAHGMYCWDDLPTAEEDVARAVDASRDDHPVIFAGFSQGGGLAVRVALRGELPARGFVSVAPSFFREGVTPGEIASFAPAARSAGVRGWMSLGEDDDRYRDRAEDVAHRLANDGVTVNAVTVAGVGHDYPEPFGETIDDALTFVLAE
jgi:predicted esterase